MWEEAVEANRQILSTEPNDVDALMRLSRACRELSRDSEAIETAKKVLEIDPQHPIARKCLEKWSLGKNDGSSKGIITKGPSTLSFIEEPGKTKIVKLINTGDFAVLSSLEPGQEVQITASAHRAAISTTGGKYIGRLPDDLAARIIPLIKAGNVYETCVKAVDGQDINVFIRETKRAQSIAHISSFPHTGNISPIKLKSS